MRGQVKFPKLKFQTGTQLYDNVNFAVSSAEKKASEIQKPVSVYHNVDGVQGIVCFTAKPKEAVDSID